MTTILVVALTPLREMIDLPYIITDMLSRILDCCGGVYNSDCLVMWEVMGDG